MNSEVLPSCLGYFGKPVGANTCQNCGWADLCRKVVAKERLSKLLVEIQEAKAIIKGEV
jgi:hypothetical protein